MIYVIAELCNHCAGRFPAAEVLITKKPTRFFICMNIKYTEYLLTNDMIFQNGPRQICVRELDHQWFRWMLALMQHQAITWSNDDLFLTGRLRTNLSDIPMYVQPFPIRKKLKMLFTKWYISDNLLSSRTVSIFKQDTCQLNVYTINPSMLCAAKWTHSAHLIKRAKHSYNLQNFFKRKGVCNHKNSVICFVLLRFHSKQTYYILG